MWTTQDLIYGNPAKPMSRDAHLLKWDGPRWTSASNHALYLKCREKAAREASPTACIIDSQSVKSAEKALPAENAEKLIEMIDAIDAVANMREISALMVP